MKRALKLALRGQRLLIYMGQFQANDPDDDQENGDESNDVIGIAKKENAADDCPGCANPCPNSVSSSNGNAFHRLRDGEEAEDDKDDSDDARNNLGKPLAEF